MSAADSPAGSTQRRKVLLLANTSWNVANFRAGLVRALVELGHEVVVAAPRDAYSDGLAALGCRYQPVEMAQHGRSPIGDGLLLARLIALMARERPAAMLGFTIKPNIYGSFAARAFGIPTINNIAGLGRLFSENGIAARLAPGLYRAALARASTVFFQNADDLDLFRARRIIDRQRVGLLPGSGVDLVRFAPSPLPGRGDDTTFLLVARLLLDKGLREFAEAARALKPHFPQARFRIAGPLGTGDGALPRAELDAWAAEGIVDYAGAVDDVRPLLADADCVVLPSYYREGTPRALLEAAAAARPVITTDMPGCRDTVEDRRSGFIVPPRDAGALGDAMRRFLETGQEARTAMGDAGRRLVERRYDEEIVIAAYREALESAWRRSGPNA